MNADMFPEEALLNAAEQGNLEAVAQLDAQGFILKPDESAGIFVERIRSMHSNFQRFIQKASEHEKFEIYHAIFISEKERISDEIIEEAAHTTERLYGFSVRWVPGYFIGKGLGWLWGGCALSDEEPDSVPVFIIRKRFQTARKWFVYTRDELLSHELCHAARAPLHDRTLEEHFAYAGSHSTLRRYMGNCFQSDKDAVLFILPVLLLLCVQILINIFYLPLASWPFWILAFAWPAYLLIRNNGQRKQYFSAAEKVRECGFSNPGAFLFRCTSREIMEIAGMNQESLKKYIEERAGSELRMRILIKRFQKEEVKNADDQRSDSVS